MYAVGRGTQRCSSMLDEGQEFLIGVLAEAVSVEEHTWLVVRVDVGALDKGWTCR